MSTGAIIAIVIAAIIVIALVAMVAQRQRVRKTQQRRVERDHLRDEARVRGARAEREQATADEQNAGRVIKQVTAIASYRWQNRAVRTITHGTVEIQLDTTRIRRRKPNKPKQRSYENTAQ